MECTVNYFENLFITNTSFLQDCSLINSTIPSLVDDATNHILIVTPSLDEISATVFNLNCDSAPGSDGFGVVFYQEFRDTIKLDVSNAAIQFFITGWVLPGFNVNIIILIPKVTGLIHWTF